MNEINIDIVLVIKRTSGPKFQYFTPESTWSDNPSNAWLYGTRLAFDHAAKIKDFKASVFLRLPKGREIHVDPSDFWID